MTKLEELYGLELLGEIGIDPFMSAADTELWRDTVNQRLLEPDQALLLAEERIHILAHV